MGFYNPGDVVVNNVVLAGSSGTLDVTNQIQSLSVHEDLMIPGMNASLTLLDSLNLQRMLPLIGEEILYVNYNTPSLAGLSHTFAVSSMKDASPSSALKVRAYDIECIALEAFTNKTTLVSKTYNTQLNAVVADLFENFLNSNKSLQTEATQGVQKYIVTNERPFDAINRIRKRSASISHPSSSFLFFENQRGYFYVTLEALFQQGIVASYTDADVGADNFITRNNFRTMLGYNLPDVYDTATKLGQGAFTSTVKKLDMKSLLFSSQDKGSSTGSNRSSGGFKGSMSGSGISSFIPKDMFNPDTFIDKMIAPQRAFLAEVDQMKLHIKIFGDSSLTVGQQIGIHIIVNDGSTGPRADSAQISGNYVISKLNSMIFPTDVHPRFIQVIEAVNLGSSIENS